MIPDRLKLMGVAIRIETGDASRWRRQLPETRYSGDRLVIDEAITSPALRELAFIKELTSCILYTVGADELLKDNRTLGLFSRLMHQAMQGIIRSELKCHYQYWNASLADEQPENNRIYAVSEQESHLSYFCEGIDISFFEHCEGDSGDADDDYDMPDYPEDYYDDLINNNYEDPDEVKSYWDEYLEPEEPLESWTSYSESCALSNNSGWFYGDED